jgi:hypothetical protein
MSCSHENGPDLMTNPTISDPSFSAKTEGSSALSQEVGDSLTCSDIHEVNIRFSEPGWVNGNDVGLFVKYIGVPDGEIKLNVWWDWENDPELLEAVKIKDEDLTRNGDRFDLEKVIEHSYSTVGERTERLVRVELTLKDRAGHCARNRHIFNEPPAYKAPRALFVIDFENPARGGRTAEWTSPLPVTGTEGELHKRPGDPVEYERYSIRFGGDTTDLPNSVPVSITWSDEFCAATFLWGATYADSGTMTVNIPKSGGTIGRNGTALDTSRNRPEVDAGCSAVLGHVTFQAPGVKTLRITVQRP